MIIKILSMFKCPYQQYHRVKKTGCLLYSVVVCSATRKSWESWVAFVRRTRVPHTIIPHPEMARDVDRRFDSVKFTTPWFSSVSLVLARLGAIWYGKPQLSTLTLSTRTSGEDRRATGRRATGQATWRNGNYLFSHHINTH